jgi:serine/threonine protein phosphatase PrpC
MVMRMPDATDYSWFAVFDGHGGSFTSSHAAANMMQKVVDTPEWKSGHREVKNIQAALTKGFLAEDEDLKQVS